MPLIENRVFSVPNEEIFWETMPKIMPEIMPEKKKTVKSDMVKKCKILPDKTNNHVM